MSESIDIQSADPFRWYDAEVRRLRDHLRRLDDQGWARPSHCPGWSVKDVMSHLAAGERYNQACLDGTIGDLDFSDGIDGWNARAVAERRPRAPSEVLEEWTNRQQDVRARWERLGLDADIDTSVGAYPLRLQVWHLSREYATHGDDIEVPVPDTDRPARERWRSAFEAFAAQE